MHRATIGFCLLLAAGDLLLIAPQLKSQSPRNNSSTEENAERSPPGSQGARSRGARSQGPGGASPPFPFRFPPPPILGALDVDRDGVISAAELKDASRSIATLDRDQDGVVSEDELTPDFGPGGPRRGGRGGFNPFGAGGSRERVPASEINFENGVASIPDHATYQKLSYKGEEVMIDTFLADLEFVKFTLDKAATDEQELYFINTNTHRAHMMFASVAGLPFGRGGDQMKGVLVYRPILKSPNGSAGLYTFEFEPFDAYSFELVKTCQDALIAKMPSLEGKVGYYPRGDGALNAVARDQTKYENSNVLIYRDQDLLSSDIVYLPLNPGSTYGRLRLMQLDQRPGPRDVVLYRSLPNEMPRVAGIITAVRQTPLSHVNLRAVQDNVPNAFITNAAQDPTIEPLIGGLVSYRVTNDGYEIRDATPQEVEQHFANLRPARPQTPPRDLSVQTIRTLDEIVFTDSASVGVKAANLAALRSFGFDADTVPNGYAIPFHFYDQFMKHNGFYEYASQLIANPQFLRDQKSQEVQLEKFRSLIKKGKMPDWMSKALDDLHRQFPEGSSVRCRSSTNNEDLPGFSGAGLYDSFTHHPDEGHFSKSIKQVFASLWNYRAFEERDFYRVDHFSAAMGVLVHPNYKGERANGVAVTDDILYHSYGNYYVNTQVGEDLVTNPGQASVPEELLLDWWDAKDDQVLRLSNRTGRGKQILSKAIREQLRDHMGVIHGKFAKLYGTSLESERFAMEIEFKVTKNRRLVIKQARPWVYPNATPSN